MNSKIFDVWNEDKKYINQHNQNILFREGEIWWIKLGINVGIEQNGNTANVFLRGSIKLGGVCDTPRFQKQLERTATQFDGVDFARFYLNGSEENFHKALNGK